MVLLRAGSQRETSTVASEESAEVRLRRAGFDPHPSAAT